LERDLHDGAQQRLVSLAMGLGMAKDKLDDDPERARELMAEAHEQAKQAIAELRDFARGIHPAVLGDRGLDAALSALAARSPIPVHVQASIPERPAATVEATAYFVVSEALTNVAKHAAARQAWVTVVRYGDRLVVDVRDDGRGGAEPQHANGLQAGSGLRGLRDRVAAVDGTFTLSSPLGGPTVIQVVLPCAS
jgi:signal transduction histidine kinase